MTRKILKIGICSVLIALLFIELACESSISKYYDGIYTSELYDGSGYKLDSPDTIFRLSLKLEEISGLTFIDGSHLAAVQDEAGKIYIINPKSGIIEHELYFGRNGDYEGITMSGKTVHVIKSNGNIYQFALDMVNTEVESGEIETAFTSKNDIEGITYDPQHNRLLIVTKGKGEIGDSDVKGKCVYAFDLDVVELNEDPVFSIRKKEIAAIIEKYYPEMKLKATIGPSGIAIHPLTQDIYMVAHVGKALLVFNENGELENYYPLNPSLFQQPEGICFNNKGDLFISNEAGSKPPTLLKFSYQK